MPRRPASIPDVLRLCYDEQAQHFDHTRKKERPELSRIAEHTRTYFASPLVREEIKKKKQGPVVLDIGCGSGRLFGAIDILLPEGASYTGIDFAPGMIATAKKKYPEAEWNVADMVDYIRSLPQESVDMIVGVASVQHLFPARERQLFFAELYRVLKRGGVCLLTNRSYSKRFLRNYRWQQLQALADSLVMSQRKRNDLLITRKDPNYATTKKKYERYYHLFTLHELEQLSLSTGFIIDELAYMQQDGTLGHDGNRARNTLLAVRKDVR